MNTENSVKRNWDNLTYSEQKEFLAKADYLLDRGYVVDTTVEKLAKKIFSNSNGDN